MWWVFDGAVWRVYGIDVVYHDGDNEASLSVNVLGVHQTYKDYFKR